MHFVLTGTAFIDADVRAIFFGRRVLACPVHFFSAPTSGYVASGRQQLLDYIHGTPLPWTDKAGIGATHKSIFCSGLIPSASSGVFGFGRQMSGPLFERQENFARPGKSTLPRVSRLSNTIQI